MHYREKRVKYGVLHDMGKVRMQFYNFCLDALVKFELHHTIKLLQWSDGWPAGRSHYEFNAISGPILSSEMLIR